MLIQRIQIDPNVIIDIFTEVIVDIVNTLLEININYMNIYLDI